MPGQRTAGILMLDTCFPRPVGDIGNPETFSFPTMRKTVRGAFPEQIVCGEALDYLPAFIEAGHQLVEEGACLITTSCGFLAPFQAMLAAELPVPVLTSSLMLVENINRNLPEGRCAGILTISASSITPALLQSANVPPKTPVGTTEGGREFTAAILGNRPDFDFELAREDNVVAAKRLSEAHPDVAAIVLECTNMAPYAGAISHATGLPVHSIVTGVKALYAQLQDETLSAAG